MERQRPIWIWVICIFIIGGLAASVWGAHLIATGSVETAYAQKQYFGEMGILAYFLSAIGVGINAAAGIALFRMKKAAVNLFLARLVFLVSRYDVYGGLYVMVGDDDAGQDDRLSHWIWRIGRDLFLCAVITQSRSSLITV